MTHFAILGPLEVRRDGEDVALGGPRQRAVLALLLLHANQVVSIERIADALYRGDAPATAVTQVHRQVSELRRLLDPELIETRAPGYLVRVGPDDLDLRRFERLVEGAVGAARDGDHERAASGLRAALGLWRGPALADLADAAFAEGSVARLEELRLTALEARIEADLALGRHAELIAELRGLAAEHPLRERLRELLMLGLYRSGRQVEALEEYRRAREELVRAFGLEPGPGLRRLEQAILRQDPALSPPDAERPAQRTGRVVLVVRDAGRLGLLHALAAPLARRPPRELVVALLAGDEAGLPAAVAAVEELRGDARTAAFVATRESEDIRHLADTQEADLLVLDARPELGGEPAQLAALLDGGAADVALLFAPAAGAGAGGGVLVPFGGGEHDWAAVELGAWLAAACGERLRLAGARADARHGRRDASRMLADASLAVQRLAGVAAEPVLVAPTAGGLAHAVAGASAVVVGLSPRWRQEGLGEARRTLVTAPVCPVFVVHRGLRPGGLAPAESATRFTWSIASPAP